MTERERALGRMELSVRGVGGIDSTTVTVHEGVNVLEGRNATNRTSLLQGFMAALGSDAVSLKGDREEGHVELTVDGETYTRTLEREGGAVGFGGDPYLDDPTVAELFAFLLETNQARRAVTDGSALRDIIMEPIDTAEIEAEINDLQSERAEIDSRIETLEGQRKHLPELEERKTQLDAELQEARAELSAARAKLEDADDGTQGGTERLEATLEELTEAKADLEDVGYKLETEREALASARDELASTEAQLDDVPEVSEEEVADVEDRLSALRRRKRTYDTRVSKLNRIVQFNEEMLDGDSTLRALFDGDDTEVTDALVGDAETTCWTCGSSVATDDIEGMLDRLRDLSRTQRQERNELESELDELTDRRDELAEARRRRAELSDRLETLTDDIERRERRVEELEAEEAEARNRIEQLEARADELDAASESRVPELRQAVNERTLAVERLERDREELLEDIEELEAKVEELDDLERRRDQIEDQLSELRTRIDRLEADSVDAFNRHIAELLDLLEYENLARVWIERKRPDGTGAATFDLHVVRTTEDGVTYEDTVGHLSESEREVVGIVFALAGYLVHEVYETVPIMLLDSLEAIDSERIALLVEYLADFAPTIVAALLPEDADALDNSDRRITDI